MPSKRIEQTCDCKKTAVNIATDVIYYVENHNRIYRDEEYCNFCENCGEPLNIIDDSEEKPAEIKELPENLSGREIFLTKSNAKHMNQTNTAVNKLIREVRALKEPGE